MHIFTPGRGCSTLANGLRRRPGCMHLLNGAQVDARIGIGGLSFRQSGKRESDRGREVIIGAAVIKVMMNSTRFDGSKQTLRYEHIIEPVSTARGGHPGVCPNIMLSG